MTYASGSVATRFALATPVAASRPPELPGAACATADPETFYLPDNMRGPSKRAHIERAKRVCRNCPVMAACLRWALATDEPHGVWGGLDEFERAELRRAPSGIAAILDATRAEGSKAEPNTSPVSQLAGATQSKGNNT